VGIRDEVSATELDRFLRGVASEIRLSGSPEERRTRENEAQCGYRADDLSDHTGKDRRICGRPERDRGRTVTRADPEAVQNRKLEPQV